MRTISGFVLTVILIMSIHPFCWSQKHDNKWMLGYSYGPGIAQPALDFYFGYPDTIGFYGLFMLYNTNVSMCNAQGVLQFYTNGTQIANQLHSPLAGGMNFNNGPININNQPLGVDQGAIGLPDPGSSTNYYLFHLSGGPYLTFYQPVQLKMSKIDMNLQGGLGQMVSTTNVLNTPILYRTLHAVKHGNGRDWWVVNGGFNSGQFFSLLLTPNGIDTTVISNTPVIFPFGIVRGQSNFSQDGSTYALTYGDINQQVATNQVVVYNFDRCSGIFSHRETFAYHPTIDSTLHGCAFSPSGRYLYINTSFDLYQYDLTAPIIATTKTHIATYDYFMDPTYCTFYQMRLGPDNKIYMGNWNASSHVSVINSPDSAGAACNFVQHQLPLISTYTGKLPHFPNYRLGPMTGSFCDTLTVGLDAISNPSSVIECYFAYNSLNIQLGSVPTKDMSYSIFEAKGQLIQSGILTAQQGMKFKVEIRHLLNDGVYLLHLGSNEFEYRKKFAVINSR
ncbi:MAG: hypothetical protein KBH11_09575 [Bacteroidia bacterium]|nr:hypothetical protein [Bacteroidia bacterium]